MIVQVAGCLDILEGQMLLAEGVDWIGLPLGPGIRTPELSEAQAATLVADIGTQHAVAIVYLETADAVVELVHRVGTRGVQLHSSFSPTEAERLRNRLPKSFLIKSLAVGSASLDELLLLAQQLSPFIDYFLLDTFSNGAFGATGTPHDWKISSEFVRRSERPVILAGGLDGNNVARAIAEVRPFGVDAHTRLENADGRKGLEKVRRFVRAAKMPPSAPVPD